jgi:hypothetical protein
MLRHLTMRVRDILRTDRWLTTDRWRAATEAPLIGLIVVAWLAVPLEVAAWGPGTHVALGEMVLGALYLLPPGVRMLLERYPIHFLYGSIAADISFAKKYVPEGRHCHNGHVGEEVHDEAGNDALRAVGLGYLAHLAADTVAHNLFVPRQLLLTSTTAAVGHAYWEHRMDIHVGEDYLGKVSRLVTHHDHSDADALFDRVLSATIFSFDTNRRIFRGMMRVQGDERWQVVFDQILRNSRYDVPQATVQRYLSLSFDYVMDYLARRHRSVPARFDPVGDLNLRLAKKVRRRTLSSGADNGVAALEQAADEFFPWPRGPLVWWPQARAVDIELEGSADETSEPAVIAGEPPRMAATAG